MRSLSKFERQHVSVRPKALLRGSSPRIHCQYQVLTKPSSPGASFTEAEVASLSYVEVFYPRLETLAVQTSETTPITSLVSNVGGTLGLWMGASMLTFFQVRGSTQRLSELQLTEVFYFQIFKNGFLIETSPKTLSDLKGLFLLLIAVVAVFVVLLK